MGSFDFAPKNGCLFGLFWRRRRRHQRILQRAPTDERWAKGEMLKSETLGSQKRQNPCDLGGSDRQRSVLMQKWAGMSEIDGFSKPNIGLKIR